MSRKRFNLRCPVCKSKRIIRHGSLPRWFHALPIGRKAIYIKTEVHRVEYKDCRAIRQSEIGFADPRLTYTRSLERYVLNLARYMTISDVSKHLGLSWDLIKSIQKRYLQKKYSHPNLNELKQIAIDEIYVGSRGYLTVVMDIHNGAVVFVGDGKGSEALEPFWARLRRYRKVKIEAVAIDMSPAYIKAVGQNLKKAVIVFDHFHVIKMMNEKISDFRRHLHNVTADKLQRSVLKGTRWLLLTAREKLETKEKSVERLRQALEINKPLATVYYMKEDLRQVWGWGDDKQAAEWHLKSWIEMARNSGIDMLLRFAKTLERHLDSILAYFDFDGLSTGPLEGTNNKIKTMQRKAYGYRDMDFFKLKIMALHETKYALVG
ncbi:ISL3 family transposase [Desulforhopalus sp. IMCC35007]|uniref:ISL3 family transposase n=1 Tax=Desulforhopalus sp. IMCC35007 TaxID=2569543 RepID=UPI001F0F74FB|nr:ISL3 family transposase [Desulforhopalus sp. IMCC35007]